MSTIRAVEVTFTKTGARRYRVAATRDKAPELVMDPAPGFDSFLPHDLVHFLVECEWGIQNGIFGQLAAGGDAGTFRPRSGGPAKAEGDRSAPPLCGVRRNVVDKPEPITRLRSRSRLGGDLSKVGILDHFR